jgi:hypothetical protein
MPTAAAIRALAAAAVATSMVIGAIDPALALCGTRGGPGYRSNANGRCVGWSDIGKTCGNPPTERCTAEQAHPDAEEASGHSKKAWDLRPFKK